MQKRQTKDHAIQTNRSNLTIFPERSTWTIPHCVNHKIQPDIFGFVFVLFWWFLFVCLVCLLLSVLVVDDDGLLDYVQVLHQFSFVALNSRWPRVLIWNYCFCNAIERVKRPGGSHEGVGRKKQNPATPKHYFPKVPEHSSNVKNQISLHSSLCSLCLKCFLLSQVFGFHLNDSIELPLIGPPPL